MLNDTTKVIYINNVKSLECCTAQLNVSYPNSFLYAQLPQQDWLTCYLKEFAEYQLV